jgi:hypothetical protein
VSASVSSQSAERFIRAADGNDRLAEVVGDESCARLAALGQHDAAAKQAHRRDQLGQVRASFGDRNALIGHSRTVPKSLIVQQDAMYNTSVRPTRRTEVRHHPEGKTCHHFYYHGLTCDEYDLLRARADGRCEICGIPEAETPRGSLVVDHFQKDQISFIRGMLCDRCNNGVMNCIDGFKVWGANRKWEAAARRYEANSWEKPSAAALEAMAARTEMLPKGQPVRPFDRSRVNVISIPSRRGVPAMADRLRVCLTADERLRLAELLMTEAEGTTA